MFSIYKSYSFQRLLSNYDSLGESLDALAYGNYLEISGEFSFTSTESVLANNITFNAGGNDLQLYLGSQVSRFTLYGTGKVTVHAADIETRIKGNESDNVLVGNNQYDHISGDGGDDFLVGGGGNDKLFGNQGADILVGGAGKDKMSGGGGDDTIVATEGVNVVTGGQGADNFIVSFDEMNKVRLHDFSAEEGDTLTIQGLDGVTDWESLLENADVISQGGKHIMIRVDNGYVQFRNMDLPELDQNAVGFSDSSSPIPVEFESFELFEDTGLYRSTTSVNISGTIYHQRDGEPPHENYKYQDADGNWWSPDYFILAAAGQSNMKGAGSGGDATMNPDVVAYDYVNDQFVQADYHTAPAGGDGVRIGTTLMNNLYFPLANRLAEELDQPILVVAKPVSGTKIEGWLNSDTDPEDGVYWRDLATDIETVMSRIGQDKIDLFTWLQGESDFSMPTDEYKAKFLEFIDQMRATDWADPDTAVIAGELSREGVNFVQNRAYQELEIEAADPFIQFASSTGLTSWDKSGVHFDGQSLVEYGYQRYWEAFERILQERNDPGSSAFDNTAPELLVDAPVIPDIVLSEGEEFRFDVAGYFTDQDGDDLYYYSYLDQRNVYLYETEGNEIVLNPEFDHAGVYTITIYANDYHLDGASFDVSLTVLDATPLVRTYYTRNLIRELDLALDFESAQDGLTARRGVEILDQDALSLDQDNVVSVNSLYITGGSGIEGSFVLEDTIKKVYLLGDANFDVTGNAQKNYVSGNDGDNTITGLGGRDRLYGGFGEDTLFGGSGNDALYGEDGDDYINCGQGRDNAWGGEGSDTFAFTAGDETLFIRDYDSDIDQDIICLSGFDGITDFATLLEVANSRDSNGRVVIDIGDDRILVFDMTVAELTADMFAFV